VDVNHSFGQHVSHRNKKGAAEERGCLFVCLVGWSCNKEKICGGKGMLIFDLVSWPVAKTKKELHKRGDADLLFVWFSTGKWCCSCLAAIGIPVSCVVLIACF